MEEKPRLPSVEASPDPDRKKSKEKKKDADKTRPGSSRPVSPVPPTVLGVEFKAPKPLDERLKELFGQRDEAPLQESTEKATDGTEPSKDAPPAPTSAETKLEPAELEPYRELEAEYPGSGEVPLGTTGHEAEIPLTHSNARAETVQLHPRLAEAEPQPPPPRENESQPVPPAEVAPSEATPIEAEAELPPTPEPETGRTGGDGGGGETPPPDGPETPAPGPEPAPRLPLNPFEAAAAATWVQPSETVPPSSTGSSLSAEQLRSHQQEVADAARYAARRGENRGILAGLLAGGLIEHFRHRHREKKREKQHRKEQKHVQQLLSQERTTAQQRFAHQEAEQGKLSQRLASTEVILAKGVTQREELKSQPEKVTVAMPEKPSSTPHSLEQLPEEEPVALPPDHRVESSSWHRIEIDARTGKPVEQPVVEYGQEFQRELSHEARPADLVAANSIGTSIVGSAVGSDQPTASAAPSPHTDPAIQSILQPPSTPPPILTSHPTSPRPTNDAPLGLWIALVIIVLAIIAALILR